MRPRVRTPGRGAARRFLWFLLGACLAAVGGQGRNEVQRGGRGRRQAARGYVGMESSTPANPERAPGTSMYPWAIVWGPTAGEEIGTETTAIEGGPSSPHPLQSTPGRGSTPWDPDWFNQGEMPATIEPSLFGRSAQGTDPQLYVTVAISALIILGAISLILKFCWDRNWSGGREVTRSQGTLTEDSCRALTGYPGPSRRGIGGFFSPRQAVRTGSPDSEPASPIDLAESRALAGKGARFQRNRIPLVNL